MTFVIGCLFIFLSFCFAPFIVVAPRKCANLFNAGSICILASFALIRGTYQFLVNDMLCNKSKAFFAWVYLLSLLTTIFASMFLKSYILTIIALVIEMLCLLYFICSFFPYGAQGFKYMLNFIGSAFSSCFGR